ncbi:Yqey-like protein-domain-containing protein [Usnea florida]
MTTASSPSTAPSLLRKVRSDLKDAMKARDSSRLDVLRGLISDVTNAAKTTNPVTTDAQMLKIIQRRVKSSEAAVEEFQSAKRDDLKDREVAQIALLEAYIDSNVMGENDITRAIQDVIGRMRSEEKIVNQGSVMKSLVGPGGSLENQPVDRQIVSRLVKGML